MDKRVKDLTGLRWGFLKVTNYLGQHKRGALWELTCVCGKTVRWPSGDISKALGRGAESSCGCKTKETIGRRNTKHKMSFHPGYRAWDSAKARCHRPTHAAWKNYGGRGIKVCERWRHSFANFWADMGPSWQPGLTLERENNALGYAPGNCVWATALRQHNNTRTNTYLETPAGRMTVADAARHYSVAYGSLLYRLKKGWPLAKP